MYNIVCMERDGSGRMPVLVSHFGKLRKRCHQCKHLQALLHQWLRHLLRQLHCLLHACFRRQLHPKLRLHTLQCPVLRLVELLRHHRWQRVMGKGTCSTINRPLSDSFGGCPSRFGTNPCRKGGLFEKRPDLQKLHSRDPNVHDRVWQGLLICVALRSLSKRSTAL